MTTDKEGRCVNCGAPRDGRCEYCKDPRNYSDEATKLVFGECVVGTSSTLGVWRSEWAKRYGGQYVVPLTTPEG